MTNEQDECPGCPLCSEREHDDARGDCKGCPICAPGEIELEGEGALTVTGQGKLSIGVALSGQGSIAANEE